MGVIKLSSATFSSNEKGIYEPLYLSAPLDGGGNMSLLFSRCNSYTFARLPSFVKKGLEASPRRSHSRRHRSTRAQDVLGSSHAIEMEPHPDSPIKVEAIPNL